MSETIIRVGGDELAEMLEGHWTQGDYDAGESMCLHGAIRRCCPVPGDAYLIEQVEARLERWSTRWNDAQSRTEGEVVALARRGWDITDADLEATFGPQWRAVVAFVRRAAVLTETEARDLGAARAAAWAAARDAAWGAAGAAAWAAARDAARGAAWDAVLAVAAWGAAWDAVLAVAAWDLATADGPYTIAQRDLLIGPWRQVIGDPTDVIERTRDE